METLILKILAFFFVLWIILIAMGCNSQNVNAGRVNYCDMSIEQLMEVTIE